MTETKVVVAEFDANGNGFSNCELVIRTVPGHITQQAADPSHLPAEVLEHLVDWALAGLEEQTPTTDTEPGPSLDEDRVRQIIREELDAVATEVARPTAYNTGSFPESAAPSAMNATAAAAAYLSAIDLDEEGPADPGRHTEQQSDSHRAGGQ